MFKVIFCHHGHLGMLSKAIREQLADDPELQVQDNCQVSEVHKVCEALEPDVVVLLTGLPWNDDLLSIAALCRHYPGVPVVALSVGSGLSSYEQPLLRAGVARVLPVEEALHLRDLVHELAARRLRHAPAR